MGGGPVAWQVPNKRVCGHSTRSFPQTNPLTPSIRYLPLAGILFALTNPQVCMPELSKKAKMHQPVGVFNRERARGGKVRVLPRGG